MAKLEVVVPHDLAVSVLNGRHRELSELEERNDCRIHFVSDHLMKAREFRLVPTARKGERRDSQRGEKSVRPGLLAPLMVEQAKMIKLAKEVAAMKPDDLERELEEGVRVPMAEAARPVAQVQAVVAPRVPTLWEEAATLRRLLFSPNGAMPVAPPPRQELAPQGSPASLPPRRSRGGRHRRR